LQMNDPQTLEPFATHRLARQVCVALQMKDPQTLEPFATHRLARQVCVASQMKDPQTLEPFATHRLARQVCVASQMKDPQTLEPFATHRLARQVCDALQMKDPQTLEPFATHRLARQVCSALQMKDPQMLEPFATQRFARHVCVELQMKDPQTLCALAFPTKITAAKIKIKMIEKRFMITTSSFDLLSIASSIGQDTALLNFTLGILFLLVKGFYLLFHRQAGFMIEWTSPTFGTYNNDRPDFPVRLLRFYNCSGFTAAGVGKPRLSGRRFGWETPAIGKNALQ
jgi:hypothetical protein